MKARRNVTKGNLTSNESSRLIGFIPSSIPSYRKTFLPEGSATKRNEFWILFFIGVAIGALMLIF